MMRKRKERRTEGREDERLNGKEEEDGGRKNVFVSGGKRGRKNGRREGKGGKRERKI